MNQQRNLASQNMLAGGLGLGATGLMGLAGKAFPNEIRGGVRSLFGLDQKPGGAPGNLAGEQTLAQQTSPNVEQSFNAGAVPGTGVLGAAPPTIDFGTSNFGLTPDFGNFASPMPALDLSGLDFSGGLNALANLGLTDFNNTDFFGGASFT